MVKDRFRFISMLLCMALLTGQFMPFAAATPENSVTLAGYEAIPMQQTIFLDGEPLEIEAYNIGGSNYFKLQDIAFILSGTPAQFDVAVAQDAAVLMIRRGMEFSGIGFEGLTAPGEEIKTAYPYEQVIYLEDERIPQHLAPASFSIEREHYLRLRDLSDYIGFIVQYEAEYDIIMLHSDAQIYRELRAAQFVAQLVREDYEACVQYFSENMRSLMTTEMMASTYQYVTDMVGAYVQALGLSYTYSDGYHVFEFTLEYEQMNLLTIVTLNDYGEVEGLFSTLVTAATAPQIDLPDGVVEELLVVDAGSGFPLQGLLSLPAFTTDLIPAVVLVHGSGASDMDETVWSVKPFRDIAYALADVGIAVLRYDKRAFTYGEEHMFHDINAETVEDAVAALNLLLEDPRIDPAKIYIIGHSLGGMIAPRIAAQVETAGVVIMAGSLRSLAEIIYDQNMASLELMFADNAEAIDAAVAMVEAEMARYHEVMAFAAEDVGDELIFGTISAGYFWDMHNAPAVDYLHSSTYPVLVLQGAEDFQVYAEVDFLQYVALAEERQGITTILYPGLGHLFTESNSGDISDYAIPSVVDATVLQDIIDWINAQNE